MKMYLRPFIYNEHLTPLGLLPREHIMESSAAFHFCKLANVALAKIPEQVTYEGRLDQTVSLRNIANGVAILYQLQLEDFMRFIPLVKREATRCNLGWDTRLDAWHASGGKSWDEVTREEGRLNIQ